MPFGDEEGCEVRAVRGASGESVEGGHIPAGLNPAGAVKRTANSFSALVLSCLI
jgi:hypothetical protein